jgi:hypothetical protein
VFRRRRAGPAPAVAATAQASAEPCPPAPELHHSPGLRALLGGLPAGRKVAVLDLGPVAAENVEFFAERPCRLYVEDLFRSFAGAPEGGRTALRDLLAYPPETRLDAVLAWDLFDYLEAEVTTEVVARLRRLCAPGALLFTLAGYLAQIPAHPIRFKIADAETLVYADRSPQLRPSPRHAAREMDRLLAGFRMEASYLLRNGWQEFLYARDG